MNQEENNNNNIIELPEVDNGSVYFKISELIENNEFKFNLQDEISFVDLQAMIPDFPFIKLADCVLNLKENFSEQSRITEFITGKDYQGPLVRYRVVPDLKSLWNKPSEWVYCILYDGQVVKIGMTSNSLVSRFGSYISGSKRIMMSGQCSTTNFVLSECNYLAVRKGIKVEIYAYELPSNPATFNVFGEMITFSPNVARKYETVLIAKVKEKMGKEPVLCGYVN
jgi:hypothetical protein